jgi:hypothetical protein
MLNLFLNLSFYFLFDNYAFFILEWVRTRGKHWITAGRADEPYGDRNFCCAIVEN